MSVGFDFGKTLAPSARSCVCGKPMNAIAFEPAPIADCVFKTWECPSCHTKERRRYGGYEEDYDSRDVLNK